MSFYQKQREHIKKNIFDTSIKIFKEKGYESATIDEITKAVGVAKGTFYNFYTSKGEILLSWAVMRFQRINMEEAFNNEKSLEENLFKLIDILVQAIKDEEELFRSFLKELLRVHGDKQYNQYFDFVNIYNLLMKNSMDFGKVDGPLLYAKVEVLNNSLFMGMINWFDKGKSTEGLSQHLKRLAQVCLNGIIQ